MARTDDDIQLGAEDRVEESPIRRYARRTHSELSRRSDPRTIMSAGAYNGAYDDAPMRPLAAYREPGPGGFMGRGETMKSVLAAAAALPIAFLVMVAVAVVFLGPPDTLPNRVPSQLPDAAASLQRAVSTPMSQLTTFGEEGAAMFTDEAVKTAEQMAAEADAALKVGGEALLEAAMAIGIDGDRVAVLTEKGGESAITVYDMATGAVLNTLAVKSIPLGQAGAYTRAAAAKDVSSSGDLPIGLAFNQPEAAPAALTLAEATPSFKNDVLSASLIKSASAPIVGKPNADPLANAAPLKALPGAPQEFSGERTDPIADTSASIETTGLAADARVSAVPSATAMTVPAEITPRAVETLVELSSPAVPSTQNTSERDTSRQIISSFLPRSPSLKWDRLPFNPDALSVETPIDPASVKEITDAPGDKSPELTSTEALNLSAQAALRNPSSQNSSADQVNDVADATEAPQTLTPSPTEPDASNERAAPTEATDSPAPFNQSAFDELELLNQVAAGGSQ